MYLGETYIKHTENLQCIEAISGGQYVLNTKRTYNVWRVHMRANIH